ncbi:NAD(P)H-dependent oxidoreductase, partial [uncultured Cetobacterium sp.]
MKILVLNGSPRLDGNTKTALNTIIAGINKNCTNSLVEIYDVTEHKLS